MTIITNKYTLSIILLVLLGSFFYLSYNYVTEDTELVHKNITENEFEETVASKNVTDNFETEFIQGIEENKVEGEREFFVEYRLERERVRSRQIELLQQIVENPNSVAETRQEAQQKLLELATYFEQELQLENMIIAKGYKDAVLFIQPNQVVAVINQKELNEQDLTIIADVISNITAKDRENIVIVPKG